MSPSGHLETAVRAWVRTALAHIHAHDHAISAPSQPQEADPSCVGIDLSRVRGPTLEQDLLRAGYRDIEQVTSGEAYASIMHSLVWLIQATPETDLEANVVERFQEALDQLPIFATDTEGILNLLTLICRDDQSDMQPAPLAPLRATLDRWAATHATLLDALPSNDAGVDERQKWYLLVLRHMVYHWHDAQAHTDLTLRLARYMLTNPHKPVMVKRTAKLLRLRDNADSIAQITTVLIAAIWHARPKTAEVQAQMLRLQRAVQALANQYLQTASSQPSRRQAPPQPFILQIVQKLAGQLGTADDQAANEVTTLLQECSKDPGSNDNLLANVVTQLLGMTARLPSVSSDTVLAIELAWASVSPTPDELALWSQIITRCYIGPTASSSPPDRAQLITTCARHLQQRFAEVAGEKAAGAE